VLRGLIDRLVLPGGFVYVSYNALPGWAHELPLRKLLVELAAAVDGDAGEQSERAAEAIEALSDADLRYFSANPGAKSAVEAYRRGEGEYLAHEFMNAAWEPFYAIDVADELATIGLQPVGSATLATNHLPLILDAKAAEAITRLATPRQQQLAVDFATNQRFRRDVFVRPDGSPSHRHRVRLRSRAARPDRSRGARRDPVPGTLHPRRSCSDGRRVLHGWRRRTGAGWPW
jgi:hypothetical protein